jgi:preprotein translocase subunit SecA
VLRELERRVLLSVLDRKWREHLYEMDYLQEGIGLRAMAQRDPLVEYQREGFDMFAAMMEGVKEESVGFLFNLEVQVDEEPAGAPAEPAESVGAQPQLDLSLIKSAPDEREHSPEARPQVKAKGLDREPAAKPMIYSAPELGSDAPAVKTASGDGEKPGAQSATARRQQARQNPNRGSRGNKGGRRKR